MWLHVDGAYGLPAAAAPATRGAVRGARPRRLGRRSTRTSGCTCRRPAASCSCATAPRWSARSCTTRRTCCTADDGLNAVDRTLEYSRPFRALKLWLAFRVHGAAAFREAIGDNVELARRLAEIIRAHPELELVVAEPQLSTVPFRHVPPGVADLDAHNLALVEALQNDSRVYVSSASIDGRACLRPCIVNFRTTEEDVAGARRRGGRAGPLARRGSPDLTAMVMPSAIGTHDGGEVGPRHQRRVQLAQRVDVALRPAARRCARPPRRCRPSARCRSRAARPAAAAAAPARRRPRTPT